MTVAYIGNSAIPTGTATGVSTTATLTLTIPACQAGDLLVCYVGGKPDTITISTPVDWTNVSDGEAAGGGGTTGGDAGPTRLKAFYRVVPAGGLSGSLAISLAGQNVAWGCIEVLRGYGSSWSVAGANGIDSTTGSPFTASMNVDPGITSGDMVLVGGCIPTDVSTGGTGAGQFTAETLTATGITATVTEIGEPDSTAGNDIGGVLCYATVNSGSSAGVATFSATAGGTTGNVRGPIVLVRIRETSPPPSSGIYEALEAPPPATANGTTVTTANFTPAANTLLVALGSVQNGSGTGSRTGSVTDSSGAVWTLVHSRRGTNAAEIWMLDAGASPASRTITYTASASADTSLTVLCLGNAASLVNQTGATGLNNGTSSWTVSITTTTVGSLVLGVHARNTDGTLLVANSITTLYKAFTGSSGSSGAQFRATDLTVTPGTIAVGGSNAASGENGMAALEVLPGATTKEASAVEAVASASALNATITTTTGAPVVVATASVVNATITRSVQAQAGVPLVIAAVQSATRSVSHGSSTAVATGSSTNATPTVQFPTTHAAVAGSAHNPTVQTSGGDVNAIFAAATSISEPSSRLLHVKAKTA